jgi:hypothetical protein
MLYLVIYPASDYEMFNDGDIRCCMNSIKNHIVEANSPKEAISKHFEIEDYDENFLEYALGSFCLEVASKECVQVSAEDIKKLQNTQKQLEQQQEREKDLEELERLKKKLGL